ncbi:MAG: S-adenosylmethionine:tRNA ribosyltransferase-isomerase [Schleiferiaceae bacterium]|nr:S-adenosylmethionine:tRNA ribosyltransferase-isomerase [Schleiferiaceae bacterium]
MRKSDFEYDLPEERIATYPLAQRDESKLLVFDGKIEDRLFKDLPVLIPSKSQLIFNNTRVIRARLHFIKTQGAKPIEIFCLTPHGQSVEESMNAQGSVLFECLIGNLKKWKNHALELVLPGGIVLKAHRKDRLGDVFVVLFEWDTNTSFSVILEQAGKIPLPPYMNREAEANDIDRYQTVYAENNGSVAAPTAGLHFTQEVFQRMNMLGHERMELTLHVGAGTFKPLSDGDINAHDMHAEEILITQTWLQQYLNHEGPKFAVGTTSLRTLESCHWIGNNLLTHGQLEPLGQFDAYALPQERTTRECFKALLHELKQRGLQSISLKTQLMIRPGYHMKSVRGILTNFHQPGSTLLLLVSAGIGDSWKAVYQHGLDNAYRFLSYGDSSLLYFK